jgi:hypothetical protein
MQQSNTDVAELVRALRSVLGENDMMVCLGVEPLTFETLRRMIGALTGTPEPRTIHRCTSHDAIGFQYGAVFTNGVPARIARVQVRTAQLI